MKEQSLAGQCSSISERTFIRYKLVDNLICLLDKQITLLHLNYTAYGWYKKQLPSILCVHIPLFFSKKVTFQKHVSITIELLRWTSLHCIEVKQKHLSMDIQCQESVIRRSNLKFGMKELTFLSLSEIANQSSFCSLMQLCVFPICYSPKIKFRDKFIHSKKSVCVCFQRHLFCARIFYIYSCCLPFAISCCFVLNLGTWLFLQYRCLLLVQLFNIPAFIKSFSVNQPSNVGSTATTNTSRTHFRLCLCFMFTD